MKKIPLLLLLSFIFGSCLIIMPDNTPPPTEKDLTADPDSGRNVNYLSKEEKQVIYFLNLARRDPAGFAEKYISPWKNTAEGAECYREMRKTSPMSVLKPSLTLSLSARDHALDMGKTGREGHTGSDGSTLPKRIARHGKWSYTIGENCAYGYDSAQSIVVGLLIDAGVPDRGHRKNILNPAFRFVGIGIRPHTKYRTNCVQDFAGGVDK
jgi:hypothetical protein